jgi:hypothetical protein
MTECTSELMVLSPEQLFGAQSEGAVPAAKAGTRLREGEAVSGSRKGQTCHCRKRRVACTGCRDHLGAIPASIGDRERLALPALRVHENRPGPTVRRPRRAARNSRNDDRNAALHRLNGHKAEHDRVPRRPAATEVSPAETVNAGCQWPGTAPCNTRDVCTTTFSFEKLVLSAAGRLGFTPIRGSELLRDNSSCSARCVSSAARSVGRD